MRKLASLFMSLVLILAALPAMADHPGGATARDIQRLQDDLQNLQESLDLLDPNDSRTVELRRREDEIRDDVTWLKVQLRRHQRDRRTGLGASKAEVEDIRRAIADLQRDVDGVNTGRWSTRDVTVSEGTQIQVRLEDTLSSGTARVEDRFEATVALPVRDNNGRLLIPAGTRVRGIVQDAERAQRPAKGGRLDLVFDSIYLDDRTSTGIRTRVVSVKEGLDKSETGKKAGIGAVLGTVLGGMLGGKKGALIGLVIGGTGGVVATAGEDVVLPAGTILTLSLERPLVVQRV